MASLLKIALPRYMSTSGRSGHPAWVGDIFGNNNYQVGGDTLNESDFGLAGIETFMFSAGGRSPSGNYYAASFPPANSANINERNASTWASVTVKWYYSGNNNEVANNTNISTESARVEVRGC